LDDVPVPLLEDLVTGRWLPIIGAGLSKNAELPAGASMPDWHELGERLGRQLPPGYAAENPLETISAYEHAFGRNKLIDSLQRELAVAGARPGRVHDAFSTLPFDVVVTTNVEQLLEMQYRLRYGSILQTIEQEQLRVTNPYPSPRLVKLHGDLQHPSSLILTEPDYDEFLDRRPLFATWLANQLISKTGVLIGYSLDDPDFRAVLAWIRARLGRVAPDLYVFEVDADPAKIDRYERRGVRVINLHSKNRDWAILEVLFRALTEYWEAQAPSRVTATTTISRTVLRARARLSRVVLFVVDKSRVSDYDENVFPSLIELGLVPITEEDIAIPPGNQLVGLDLLLRAANQVVVETRQPADPQLERVVRAVGYDRVLVVSPSDTSESMDRYRWRLQRPSTAGDWMVFSSQLVNLLQEQRRSLTGLEQGTAAGIRTLFTSGKVQMAFLSGVVELEGRLNRLLPARDLEPKPFRGRPASLRNLLELASDSGLLAMSADDIVRLTDGRNRVVHGQELAPAALSSLTELVINLLAQLPED
jgi:SIR2-like domain